jgi:hypothetical protein
MAREPDVASNDGLDNRRMGLMSRREESVQVALAASSHSAGICQLGQHVYEERKHWVP